MVRRFTARIASRALVVSFASVTLAGCSGDSAPTAVETDPVGSLSLVQLVPSDAQLTVGAQIQLQATVRANGGLEAARDVRYTSSQPAVAVVDADGLVTAIGEGSTVITGLSGGLQSQATIGVGPAGAPFVSISDPQDRTIHPLGTTVVFRGTASDPEDGALTGGSLVWTSHRDGVIGQGSPLSVSTLARGDHTITLTATDSQGNASTDEIHIAIYIPTNQPPTVAITSPDDGEIVVASASVTLVGSATDPDEGSLSGSSLQWSSNLDGNLGTGGQVTVTLSTGDHVITLTATDSQGASASAQVDLTVVDLPTDQPPTVSVTAPQDGSSHTVGQPVLFAASATDAEDGTLGGASLVWTSSRNGQIGTGSPLSTSALSTGSHIITATGTDSAGNSTSDQIQIDITAAATPVPPIADAGGPYSSSIGSAVSFDGSGSSDPDGTITTYAWTFGDGASGSGVNPSHAYAAASTFTVCLTVTDDDGQTAQDCTTAAISASNQKPNADAGPDQAVTDTDGSGDEPVTLDASGSSDSDGTIVSYRWQSNGALIATGVTPTVSLPVARHVIWLSVTDNHGEVTRDAVVITVVSGGSGSNVKPDADAGPDQTATDTDGSGTETVALDGSGSSDSDGSIASYSWRENGNQIATGQSPNVTLAMGTHTITLRVTDDDGATDTDQVVITIEPAPPPPTTGMILRPGNGSPSSVQSGSSFTLPLHVDLPNVSNTNLASLSFTVTFDPAKVRFDGYSNGGFSLTTVNDSQKSSGVLVIGGANANGVNNSFDAVRLNFTALSGGSTTISPTVTKAGKQNGSDITGQFTAVPLTLTIN